MLTPSWLASLRWLSSSPPVSGHSPTSAAVWAWSCNSGSCSPSIISPYLSLLTFLFCLQFGDAGTRAVLVSVCLLILTVTHPYFNYCTRYCGLNLLFTLSRTTKPLNLCTLLNNYFPHVALIYLYLGVSFSVGPTRAIGITPYTVTTEGLFKNDVIVILPKLTSFSSVLDFFFFLPN